MAPGELVLVVRQGEVVRVRRNGFVARWPGLERFEPLTTEPRVVPLVVRSRTSDGVDVVALADLTVQVRDVEPGTAYVPPAQAARLAEETVARASSGSRWGRSSTTSRPSGRGGPARSPALPVGTAATALAVTEVEARLTGGAA